MPSAETPAGRALEIGARLSAPPDPAMVAAAFAGELEGQKGLAAGMGLADLAHTVMLVEQKVIPKEPGAALLAALLELQRGPEGFVLDPALGDLYTNREAWIAQRTEAAGWLGAGRARREATTTAWHLAVRAGVLDCAAALADCGEALARKAAALRDALAPDYTYLQAAQPTSFGHYLLTFCFPILRDLDRLRSLHARIDRSPAGCGSANGSRLPQDRERLSELLGFAGPVVHARDAMWQADAPIECLGAIVAALVNLDRLAEDLFFFATAEAGLVELSDAHARASKILPQKKNPYALAWVRAVANEMIGVQAAVAASGRTPSGQLDNRLLAYRDVPRALASAAGAARLMAGVVDGLRFDAARAAERLARSFTAATDLSEVLVLEAGLDYRAAQRVIGALAREFEAQGRRAASLTPADLAAAAERAIGKPVAVSPESIARALDPAQAVKARTGLGGAAPEPLEVMIAACRAALAEQRSFCAQAAAAALRSEQSLLATAAELSGGGSWR